VRAVNLKYSSDALAKLDKIFPGPVVKLPARMLGDPVQFRLAGSGGRIQSSGHRIGGSGFRGNPILPLRRDGKTGGPKYG